MMNEDKKRLVKSIFVNKSRCIGAATCLAIAPSAFELNKEGVSEVLPTYLQNSDDDLIKAAKSCPSHAIVLLDQDNKEIPLD
jgi:ferredoxin